MRATLVPLFPLLALLQGGRGRSPRPAPRLGLRGPRACPPRPGVPPPPAAPAGVQGDPSSPAVHPPRRHPGRPSRSPSRSHSAEEEEGRGTDSLSSQHLAARTADLTRCTKASIWKTKFYTAETAAPKAGGHSQRRSCGMPAAAHVCSSCFRRGWNSADTSHLGPAPGGKAGALERRLGHGLRTGQDFLTERRGPSCPEAFKR